MDDTICAVSTAPGVGGIAVIRVSGPRAIELSQGVWRGKALDEVKSHTVHLGDICTVGGELLDRGVATVYRGPHSFTGEDVVEFAIHGSLWLQREVVNQLVEAGCRVAAPGEFTRRAFRNGRMDLTEAEAVADLIASTSRASHRIAVSHIRGDFARCLATLRSQLVDLASLLELELDFSEEDVEFASRERLRDIARSILSEVTRLSGSFAVGRAIKDGIPVAIIGAPNAGKSTLLNRLTGDDRAIVSDIPGTTRDVIEDRIEIDGLNFRLNDTAGLHHTDDVIESLGIERTTRQIEQAKIVVWVVDPFTPDDQLQELREMLGRLMSDDATMVMAVNKSDIYGETVDNVAALPGKNVRRIRISAKTGWGIDELTKALVEASGAADWQNALMITNARHYEALTRAKEAITRVIEGIDAGISGDFIAQDVRDTIHHLGEITGAITTTEILSTVFSRFCIGK